MKPNVLRPLAGLALIVVIGIIVGIAVTLFSGGFTDSVPVTVLSKRAGLVMNPDASVQMRGVDVGKVESIEARPDGQAALLLAMDPSQLHLIPANVIVDIASTTVFGAKSVQLIPPADPSPQPMYSGQVLGADRVTVEVNTIFEQLTSVLAHIDPAKLNATLGAISRAMSGRGESFGQTLVDLNHLLAEIDPALPALRDQLAIAPEVFNVFADTAPDLLATAANASQISQTLVEEETNLDAFLVSTIGLADTGNEVLSDNRAALTATLDVLLPTTRLVDEYHRALTCSFIGIADLASVDAPESGGASTSVNFLWGHERYRYPGDLPKVAASGGPRCEVLPVPYQGKPPYVVTDIGTNPFKYGNRGLVLNTDGLKRFLFGPIDGPPRNTAQVGQPG